MSNDVEGLEETKKDVQNTESDLICLELIEKQICWTLLQSKETKDHNPRQTKDDLLQSIEKKKIEINKYSLLLYSLIFRSKDIATLMECYNQLVSMMAAFEDRMKRDNRNSIEEAESELYYLNFFAEEKCVHHLKNKMNRCQKLLSDLKEKYNDFEEEYTEKIALICKRWEKIKYIARTKNDILSNYVKEEREFLIEIGDKDFEHETRFLDLLERHKSEELILQQIAGTKLQNQIRPILVKLMNSQERNQVIVISPLTFW